MTEAELMQLLATITPPDEAARAAARHRAVSQLRQPHAGADAQRRHRRGLRNRGDGARNRADDPYPEAGRMMQDFS